MINEGGKYHWQCTTCSIEVVTPEGALPYATVDGRQVNGRLASRYYLIPSCKARVPKPATTAHEGRPSAVRDHEMRTCYDALGRSWVEATIGPPRYDEDGELDLDWEMGLLQLYSAVNVLNLEAEDLIDMVRDRMAERDRQRVKDRGVHFSGETSMSPATAFAKKVAAKFSVPRRP